MSELTKKIDFFERMMLTFAQSKINDANDAFAKRHGYDLRKTENNDHLEFCRWDMHEQSITLSYVERTPHDCPYGIEIEYDLSDLFIYCKNQQQ